MLNSLKVNHQIWQSFRLHQIVNGAIPQKIKKAVLFIPFEAVSGNPAA
jgi:hypothetical protein